MSKYNKAHFVEIFSRTAVRHAVWLIMQIYSKISLLVAGVKTLMYARSCISCYDMGKLTHNKSADYKLEELL